VNPNKLYKLIKEQIDNRGPINYHNAMSTAHAIAKRVNEREKEEEVESP
jgi:hypothetical protein